MVQCVTVDILILGYKQNKNEVRASLKLDTSIVRPSESVSLMELCVLAAEFYTLYQAVFFTSWLIVACLVSVHNTQLLG
jgi:hypothetical protein